MQQTTGKTEVICIRPNGERIEVTLAIGHPFPTPEGDWACPATLAGLHEGIRNIHGQDSLQAICLAIAFIHTLLASFVASGGRVVFRASGENFPIDAFFRSAQTGE